MKKIIKRSATAKMADDIEKVVFKKQSPKEKRVEFLHSGSSVLNLALSGDVNGGWARGRVINIVGDGSSGKTLLALELAAWFYHNIKSMKSSIYPKVKRVKIIYYNAEEVMDFPLEEMYGKKFVDAVDWRPKEGDAMTAEGWGRDVGRELLKYKKGDAVLYIEDSIDALNPEASSKRFDKAAKEDKAEESKSYAEKASYFSQSFFSNLVGKVAGKDFTIVLISQVREKIGVVFGKKHYRTGGKSLDFYTHQVAWLAVKERMKKTVKKQERVYGVKVRMNLDRSKVSKPFRTADFDILFNYGVDDFSGLIDFVHPGCHPQKKIAMIRKMERDDSYYENMKLKAQRLWNEIENSIEPKRKKKYS